MSAPAPWRIGKTYDGRLWAVFSVEMLHGKEFRHVAQRFSSFAEACDAFRQEITA